MTTSGFNKSAPQASLHQLAEILRSAVDAIISIDATGVIESVNPATEKLFGYDSSELVGQNVRLLMPEPYRSQHDGYIRQYRHTGRRKIIGIGREVVGQCKDGSTFPMHLSVSEYEIDGKRHFAGIVHDLTAQRQAEAESARQQTLFEAIINDAPQGLIIADANHSIFLVNPAVTRIFGYAPDELMGKRSRFLYASPEDYECVARLDSGLAAHDQVAEPLRVECRRKNGDTFCAEIIATVVRDRQRKVLGLMRLVRDITEQLKQEHTLRQAQRMDALGQLTGGVAHDFNNLLTIIMGSHELFEASTDLQEARECVKRANEAAEMGSRLTSRLLSFSRQRKLEPVVVDLNDQVLNMMDLLRRTIGETIAVSTSLASGSVTVRIDPSEIENAVLNLAINARDAMPRGGRLIIETQKVDLAPDDDTSEFGLAPGAYVRLTVSDTGGGMPAHVAARAFEPYFTTKPLGRGTGLGLASVYGFVKQSGGNATIYSEPGQGTTVNLYLPCHATEVQDRGAVADTALAAAGGETVLVVEDNPEARQLSLRRIKMLGYRVLEADSGPSALAVLQGSQAIDLIFSDVVMPGGLTGYDLARRAMQKNPAIKILLTSGYDVETASGQDAEGGGFPILRKPYKQVELARALLEALRH